MKKNLILQIAVVIFIISSFFINLSPAQETSEQTDIYKGIITQIHEQPEAILEVKILNKDLKGQSFNLKPRESALTNVPDFKIGERLMIAKYQSGEMTNLYIADYDRSNSLIILFGIFVVVVVFVAKLQGLSSILGMIYSFAVLIKIILPLLLNGLNPINIALLAIILIMPVTFYLSHGINKKTTVAIAGTLITLLITSIFSLLFMEMAKLSGLASEEANFLQLDRGSINFHGLLLAGIMISALGILDDITVSQASVVTQLKKVQEKISFKKLYHQAMNIGRDHIASMVNTLVLIYTGASLPLLLLFLDYNNSFSEVINYEFMAEEIVKTMISSIGLILAVPITTALACLVMKKNDENHKETEYHIHAHNH